MSIFDRFRLEFVDCGDATLRVRVGGDGPPVLLLHGHPRTHTTWHRVAPQLAERHTVICPDLRGYGESSKPATTPDHTPYSKRSMARDCLSLMHHLGFERFALVGHDRGAYVAFRLAMDHPEAVERLVIMDAVPIGEALARCTATFASAWWHWFYLGQTVKPAEPAILADPVAWYQPNRATMGEANYQDFLRAVTNPATVHAMCEDYRAGLGVDRAADDADLQAGRRLACPLLLIRAARDDLGDLYDDPVGIWQTWASPVQEVVLDCGHHMAEEAPGELSQAILAFLEEPVPTVSAPSQ
ncbi:MAG: alpha/beta hydrolase [Thermomicrobiales bacterium]